MQKRLYFLEINFAAVLFPLELSPSQAIRKDIDLFNRNFTANVFDY
jgi:hypothetical protein